MSPRLVSNFKSYFKKGMEVRRSKLKIYYNRFSERWFRDIKFRFKMICLFFSICNRPFNFNFFRFHVRNLLELKEKCFKCFKAQIKNF
jgi:hypothetical protein